MLEASEIKPWLTLKYAGRSYAIAGKKKHRDGVPVGDRFHSMSPEIFIACSTTKK